MRCISIWWRRNEVGRFQSLMTTIATALLFYSGIVTINFSSSGILIIANSLACIALDQLCIRPTIILLSWFVNYIIQ